MAVDLRCICKAFLTFHAVFMMQIEILIGVPSDNRIRGVIFHFDGGVILVVFLTSNTKFLFETYLHIAHY